MRLQDILSRKGSGVRTIGPEATADEAVAELVRHNIGSLMVCQCGDDGQPRLVLGIITEWDVMRALLPEIPTGSPPSEVRPTLVRDAMTRSVMCVPEEMGIEEAAHVMINKNVEQFPVVNESALTGMLFRSDIIRKLFGR